MGLGQEKRKATGLIADFKTFSGIEPERGKDGESEIERRTLPEILNSRPFIGGHPTR
jgi:hypothetical protein